MRVLSTLSLVRRCIRSTPHLVPTPALQRLFCPILVWSSFPPVNFRTVHSGINTDVCSRNPTSTDAHTPITMPKFDYPKTRKDESVSEDFFGTTVPDPYNWLEDPDSAETKAWVKDQVSLTSPYIESLPGRTEFLAKLKELFDYPKYSCPYKRGNRYFFYKNDGLQNQSVLYKQDTLVSEPQTLLDPNLIREDGTAALAACKFSECGNKLAYAVSFSGSDWSTIYVRDVDSCRDDGDELKWAKFTSIAWTHDSKGFYYARYPEPETDDLGAETAANSNQQIYYHILGTPQSEDKLVFHVPDHPQWMTGVEVTDDGHYLLLTLSDSCDPVNRVYYVDLRDIKTDDNGIYQVTKLIDNFNAEYDYIANDDTVFYFKSNLNAPRYRVLSIDIAHPDPGNWSSIIPENEHVLGSVDAVHGNHLLASYMIDVVEVLRVYTWQGQHVKDLPTPCPGSIPAASTRREDSEVFYKFTSFLYPGTIFRYDFNTGECDTFREITVPGVQPDNFVTEQVFYPSKDGTKVPMFIVKSRDTKLDGSNPTLLYGYGGFNISLTPSFSVSRLAFIRYFGGVFCVANLRGGGEYGEEWHKAGTKERKQNVFDDFHAAAEYLIASKYTSPAHLAIQGGSNGGLLVAACTNQRPELYAAAVAQCGVLDMLRFHKFTIGYAWKSDYGCSEDDKESFDYLYRISPIHQVPKDKTFPHLLLTTADHDDRVCPLHSYKYIAAVQDIVGSNPAQENPLLIRIETKAGHGAGKPTAKVLEEAADVYAFIANATGAKWR
eukprot:TRINITY_DN1216_c0_g1_i2.p1 TRINITY_DN1216_c0_g1~~TRINITY_DN1216_c0_g1_i2.p1  ORF type:complete len:774 (+),score=190.38 TRINITY_DN1216_c0_g1_i2:121-2442(+)